MGPGVVEVMRSRQTKNNLSELGVNWLGNGHLNASESDLMYKYHVVSLSCVSPSSKERCRLLTPSEGIAGAKKGC